MQIIKIEKDVLGSYTALLKIDKDNFHLEVLSLFSCCVL